jgi:tetratricopeptide (TPR) repeat protein
MTRYVALCAYLDGVTLKECGRPREALAQLNLVASNESAELDDWIKGLALIYSAEIWAKEGEANESSGALAKAWTLVGDSRVPAAIAHFHAVKGQILRDLGQLDSAVESYRLAASTYEAAGCGSWETLLRIITAETLLACGRDGDALSEIVSALRIIETLGLFQEGIVAVALLRESLSRQCADREALVTLRRALQNLNEGSRS